MTLPARYQIRGTIGASIGLIGTFSDRILAEDFMMRWLAHQPETVTACIVDVKTERIVIAAKHGLQSTPAVTPPHAPS
jgi:hypothetical protein